MPPSKPICSTAATKALLQRLLVAERPLTFASTLTQPIDAYCERTSAAFWAEPINALTNLAFIVAVAVVWSEARRTRRLDAGIGVLLALIAAIGIGSFLFHTVATRWAALADVVPIMLFIVSYLTLAMRRLFILPWWASLAIGASFVPAAALARPVLQTLAGDLLGSSTGYLPALLALAASAAVLLARSHPAGRGLALGCAVFVASLTFRTLDHPLCDALPLGTHFLWHVLNGLLLALLTRTMLRHGYRP